jgi:hypothetical protein
MTNDELLNMWYAARNDLDAMKQAMEPLVAQEMELRRLVASTFWPKPEEGVNKTTLPLGYTLKYTHKLDRKVDPAARQAVIEAMQKQLFNTEGLIREVPEVNIKAYRELSDAARLIFDQCLIIRNGAPTLEIVAPKVK